MPELPEVESVVNELKEFLNLHAQRPYLITASQYIQNRKIIKNDSKFLNREILSIKRKGKTIFFLLNNTNNQNESIIIHLRLDGKILVSHNKNSAISSFNQLKENEKKYVVAYLEINKEIRIYLIDKRRFAVFRLDNFEKELNKIGVDFISEEITSQLLINNWKKRSIPLKTALLEQKIFSGIGNIYASEIAYEAQISPFTKVNKITKKQIEKIIKAGQKILRKAVHFKGATIHTYRRSKKEWEDFVKYLQVYDRNNLPCKKCQTPIIRTFLNKRSTYFCQNCQKLN